MKKFIEYLTTLAVFFDIISLPFVYLGFYRLMYMEDNPHYNLIVTILLVISHIITAKRFYDIYVDKYSNDYHDKKG